MVRILDLPSNIFIIYPSKVAFKKHQTRW
ncbi:hypothetical protein [Hathewaya limosa]